MATENLKYKITLFATFWDKKPTCEISINDTNRWNGTIDGSETSPNVIEFEHPCEEGKEYDELYIMTGAAQGITVRVLRRGR